MANNEIILYQADNLPERIEVRIEDETVWLSQQQMAELFQQTKQNISLHISNCFKEGELDKQATVKEYLTVQKEGSRNVKRKIEYYNLDMIISVGYRVKSRQGTQFRIWATNVLRDYMLKGYVLNQRMNRLENTVEGLVNKVQNIDFQIKSSELPHQGLFFDGQVYDAYKFASNVIRKATSSIVLIDNYLDDTVLTLLSKRKKNVKVHIYTASISKQLRLDVEKHNQQYPTVAIHEFKQSHDRFLIIDGSELYHIGASLKDLGKKWFAFSRMDSLVEEVLARVKMVK
ncbi:virulence RhuM family protein [Sphingobacterium faecale]|uniref:Virulence RhuM family protein n=1 Tax=Sphingobacterium faecale TaxID=2803775 RepID=A0ABS1R936_9SPHI|nr:RhuM family protein [Sphingobacterium faecale]MBL1411059.1 virulence RhuM family protein [Sphingobacterium faecale]